MMDMKNMNILPMYRIDADRHHWVVKCLRLYGYIICAIFIIAGFAAGSVFFSYMAMSAFNISKWVAVPLMTFLGGVIGFIAGALFTIPIWGISMLIDDIHALRLYAAGYVTVNEEESSD